MNEFISYLQAIGPFTTPLCIAMAYGMWWLDRDRTRILGRLDECAVDARSLRERRAEDLVHMVQDYQENAQANRDALDRLTDAVRGVGKQ